MNSETLRKEVARLRLSLEDSRVLSLQMAAWIVRNPNTTDHACSRCVPGGEIVVPGFVCAWHIAECLHAAAAGERCAQSPNKERGSP